MAHPSIISLASNPKTNYPQWKQDAISAGASYCIELGGLYRLGILFSLAEFQEKFPVDADPAHPGIVPPPRQFKTFPEPGDIPGNASHAAVAINNRMRQDRNTYVMGVSAFRTQLLESIGIDGQALLRHPETGHANVTPADIWALMAAQHGIVRSIDIRDKYRELSFIPPGVSLAAFVIASKQTHTFFELSNQALNQITKMTEFNTAIAMDKQLTRLQYQYATLEQPDFNQQTFDGLTDYVLRREKTENPEFDPDGRARDQAHHLRANPATASTANSPLPPDKSDEILERLNDIVTTLQTLQLDLLKQDMIALRAANPTSTPAAKQASAPAKPKVYCFYHGYNHDHAGIDCQSMRLLPAKYTADMLSATAPSLIDGIQGCSRYIR